MRTSRGAFHLYTAIFLTIVGSLGYATEQNSCDFISQLLTDDAMARVLNRRSVQHYLSDPALKAVSKAIAEARPFTIHTPLQFSGIVREKDGVLTISLNGIGTGVNSANPTPLTIKEQKSHFSGQPTQFTPARGLNRNLPRAIASVVDGIAARKRANPTLRKVVIESVGVMNLSLQGFLVTKMGFVVKGGSSMGGAASYDSKLELDLDKVATERLETAASQ